MTAVDNVVISIVAATQKVKYKKISSIKTSVIVDGAKIDALPVIDANGTVLRSITGRSSTSFLFHALKNNYWY